MFCAVAITGVVTLASALVAYGVCEEMLLVAMVPAILLAVRMLTFLSFLCGGVGLVGARLFLLVEWLSLSFYVLGFGRLA